MTSIGHHTEAKNILSTSSRYIILEGSEELQPMAPPAAIGLQGITVFGLQNKDHESETVPTLV